MPEIVRAEQVDRQLAGAGAVLVVDYTGLPKKGGLSVGVALDPHPAIRAIASWKFPPLNG